MLLDFGRSGVQVDRVLNGPTNEAWIHPWVEQLVRRGCRYFLNTKVTGLECSGGRITGATITPLADPPMFGGPSEAVRVLECGRYGVTANTLALGLMQRDDPRSEESRTVTKGLERGIPVGRLGTGEDVGYACAYLASAEASWMNGQTIGLNGGSVTS